MFTTVLSPLCSSYLEPDTRKTLLMAMLDHKMRNADTKEELRGVVDLIKRIFFYYQYSVKKAKVDEPKVIVLEDLFMLMIEDGHYDKETAVCNKVLVLNLIISLDELEVNRSWPRFESTPCIFLYQMLQLVEHFWYDGQKKEEILRVFRHLMRSKMDRKLTLEEFHWILGKMEDDDHTMPLVIYLREVLPLPAEELFIFDGADFYEVMLIACTIRNHGWICGRFSRDYLDTSSYTATEIAAIARFLTKDEWVNLTLFLGKFWHFHRIIGCYLQGLLEPDESNMPANRSYMVFGLTSMMKTLVLGPESEIWGMMFRHERINFVLTFQYLNRILWDKKYDERDKQRIKSVLIELAKILRDTYTTKSIESLYRAPDIHEKSMEILENIVGRFEPVVVEPKVIKFRPI